jgi:hypothetical protein
VGKPVPPPAVWDEPRPAGADLRLGPQVPQDDRGERDAGRAVADLGGVDAAAAALAGVHDAPVLDLDPGLEPVGEAEAVPRVAADLKWATPSPNDRRLKPSTWPARTALVRAGRTVRSVLNSRLQLRVPMPALGLHLHERRPAPTLAVTPRPAAPAATTGRVSRRGFRRGCHARVAQGHQPDASYVVLLGGVEASLSGVASKATSVQNRQHLQLDDG